MFCFHLFDLMNFVLSPLIDCQSRLPHLGDFIVEKKKVSVCFEYLLTLGFVFLCVCIHAPFIDLDVI